MDWENRIKRLRKEMEMKFIDLCTPVLGTKRTKTVLQLLQELEHLDRIDRLTDLLGLRVNDA